MGSPRSLASLVLCLVAAAVLASGCASYSAPAQESDDWAEDWKQRASKAAEGAAKGASVAGRAMGSAAATAFHGVRHGFEDPDDTAYGRYPEGYATTIRKHMTRFEGVPKDASFRFGKPGRGYMNKGILAGGGVAWQGYLVEVTVEEDPLFESQRKPDHYVVRMRDGDVVEVIDAEYASTLRWAERREASDSPPAARD